jgi:hypothetical protein
MALLDKINYCTNNTYNVFKGRVGLKRNPPRKYPPTPYLYSYKRVFSTSFLELIDKS